MQQKKFINEFDKLKSEFSSIVDDMNSLLKPSYRKPLSWDFDPEEPVEKKEDSSLKKDFFRFVKEKLNSFIHSSRLNRYQELRQDLKKRRYIAEGDSWFQHPMVDDVIDYLLDDGYAVCCFSAAGDTLIDMALEAEFLFAVEFERPRLFLLSGGGNDLLQPDSLRELIDPSSPDMINALELQHKLQLLEDSISSILFMIAEKNPDLSVLMHGYDYIIPRDDAVFSWVYPVMLEKGITQPLDQKNIVRVILDNYNNLLARLEKIRPGKFFYLDLRGTIAPDGWYDEIHPNEKSFRLITEKFKTRIAAILG